MWKFLVACLFLSTILSQSLGNEVLDDDEFENFAMDIEEEVEEEKIEEPILSDVEIEDESIEEDSEFDHFQDEEEFEGFDSEKIIKGDVKEGPKITITKVPPHLRTNWDSYYLEMLMIVGLVIYFINFYTGKSKNQKLANAWFQCHRQLLEENFTLVGDDGKMENENPGLMKDSENVYMLWCSGRSCCEGMLVELKFMKRQDIVGVISQLIRPTTDQVQVKVHMSKEDMDNLVLCVANKKSAAKLSKDLADLSVFATERKSNVKLGLPEQFKVMVELQETVAAILDSRVISAFTNYCDMIEYIHISDQYSGVKQPEDTAPTKLPEVEKVLIFVFNLPVKGKPVTNVMEQVRPLMQLVFYLIDKVKRFRLSKEAKMTAEKNRQRVQEAFMKTTHAARAEAAALRREEKRRLEKERILQEDDPEKQRKWEDRENRRLLKKKGPKMKQLKVKAL